MLSLQVLKAMGQREIVLRETETRVVSILQFSKGRIKNPNWEIGRLIYQAAGAIGEIKSIGEL